MRAKRPVLRCLAGVAQRQSNAFVKQRLEVRFLSPAQVVCYTEYMEGERKQMNLDFGGNKELSEFEKRVKATMAANPRYSEEVAREIVRISMSVEKDEEQKKKEHPEEVFDDPMLK
jgi:hypothetical protein